MVNCRVRTQQGGEVIFLYEDTSVQKSPKGSSSDEHRSSIGIMLIAFSDQQHNNHSETITITLARKQKLTTESNVSEAIQQPQHNTVVKVMELLPPENKAWKVYKKQDCIIADHTACCYIVLWEEDLGHLVLDGLVPRL